MMTQYYGLSSGLVVSCGCAKQERQRERMIQQNFVHGQSRTKEYKIWANMKARCLNPRCIEYGYYGARGITIDQRWIESFEAIINDVGERPPGGTLERIDNDGPYAPGNVRWATRQEQSVNRRSTIFVERDGVTLPAGHWADRLGLPRPRVYKRIEMGWPIEHWFD
jgi:hypothetical protein